MYGRWNLFSGCKYWDEVLKEPFIVVSAAGAVTTLPRWWCGGGAESLQGLEMWPGTTFPGVPLMFSYCGGGAALRLHQWDGGLVGRLGDCFDALGL